MTAVLFRVLLFSQVFLGAEFRSGFYSEYGARRVVSGSSFFVFRASFFLRLILFLVL